LFFKERISALQMSCFATLALGMMLFFQTSIDLSNDDGNQVWIGVLLVQFSALSWTCYALIQKSLLAKLSPGNVLLYIYGAGIVLMFPFSDLNYFANMSTNQWYIALFCAVNTLVAYGCFAQAMKYWSTAQVGATVALTPIFSFSFTAMIVALGWWPELIVSNPLTIIGVVGILLVVFSVLCVQLLPLMTKRRLHKIST
ncbi:MAG: DMT family transporter, partial [Psychrosphaera sp.]|nr:DMT family transporter [Psychrosphaera sp.]